MSPGAVRWVGVEVKTAPGPRPVSDYEFTSEAQLSLNDISFPESRIIQPNPQLRPHFFSSTPISPTGNRGRVRTVTLTLANQPLSDYPPKSTRNLRRATSTPHFQPTLNHSVPLPYRPTLSTSALATIPSSSTRSRLAPDKPHFLSVPHSSNSPPCFETTFDALPALTSLQPNNQSSNLIHRLIRRASSVFPLISDMSTSHSTPTLLDRTQNAYDHQLHSRFQTLEYLSTTREYDQSNLLSPQLQTSLSSSTASAHTALDTLPIPESNDRYTGNRAPDSPSPSARSRLRTPSLLLFGRSLPCLPQPHDTRPPSPSQAQEMLERSRSLPTTKELASTLSIGDSEVLDPQPPLLQTSSASQRGSLGKGALASVRSPPHFAKGRIGSPIAHVNQTTRLQSSMGSSKEPEVESHAWKLKPGTDAQASLDHQVPPPAQSSHNRPTLPAPRFPSSSLSVDDDQAGQRAKDVNHAYRSSSDLSHQHRIPPYSPPSTESFSLSQHSLTGVLPEEPQPSRSGLDLRPRISPRASVSSGTFQNLVDVNSLPRPNTTKASKSASSGVSGLVGLLSKKFKPKLKGRRSSSVSAAKLASKSTSSIVHPTSPNVLPPMPSTRFNACSSDIGHYSLPHAPKSESTVPSRAGPNRSRAPKSELIHQGGHSITPPDLLPPVPSEPSSELFKLMASSLMRPIPTPKPSLHYIPQSEMDEPEPLESEPESEVEAEVPQTDISDHSQPALQTHQEGELGGESAFQLPALPPPISPFEANFLPPRRSQSASPEVQKRAVGGTVGPARLEVPYRQGVATPDILGFKGLQNSTELRRPVDPLSALSASTSYLSSSFEHLPGSSQLEVDTPATHVSICSQLGSETNEADEDEGSYNLHTARTHLSQDPDSHWCEGLSSNTQLSPSLAPPVQLVSATDDQITPHSELTTRNSEPKDESVNNTTVRPMEQKSVSSTAVGPNYPEAVTPWEYQDVHHVQFVDRIRPQDRRKNSVKITTQDQDMLSTRNSAHQRVTPFPKRGNSSRRGSFPPSQMTAVAASDSVARGTDDLSRSGQEPSRRKSQSSNEGGTGPDLFLHLNASVSSTSSSGGTIAKLFKASNSSRSRLYRWSFSSPTALPDNNPSPLLAPASILTSSSVTGREQLNPPALASSQPEPSPSGVRGSRTDVAGRPSRTRRMSSVLSVGTQSNGLWRSQSDSMSPTSTASAAKPKSQPAQGLSRIVRSQSSANLSSSPLVRPSHGLGRGDASPLLAFTRRLSCNISSPTLPQVKVGPAADDNSEAKDLRSAPQPLCTPSESISTGPEPVKAMDSPLKLKLLPREKDELEVSYLERLGRTMEKSMIVSALGAR
ncbi:hypothetical protein CROQUDRAFT_325679 [Cronartium quercuum f. sp. fusiforme G11]|uniref:Uncharacterized protein n=1 Tax=Cronartium quercuum f. sp. fusiforme G11 TaxID=708437 RepID=A0A9P6N7T0_9BASI|nr:hypothetical protein CROQUDRAFT_325679 [Cronartium quercuum f. sp. fusiforme G11]